MAEETLAAAEPGAAPAREPGPAGRTRKRRRWPLIASLAALVCLCLWGGNRWLGAGGSGSGSSGASAAGEPTCRVVRGPLNISFTERGTIKAAKSEQLFCQLEGQSAIVNVVPEGAYVKKGDLLVELDSSSLTQLYNQQAIAVETAKAALITADEQVEIQKSQNESDIKAAELALELAGIDLKKYQEGDFPLARDKAKADIHIAEEELKRAENKYGWTEKLAKRGYVTRTELIADDLAVKKAKVQSEQATMALDVLERYTQKKDSRKVSSDLEQARRALERTERKARSLLAQALADQKAKKSTANLSMRRLDKIKDQIEKTRIVAPQSGMVVYHQDGRYGRDDRIIEQGGTVRENQHLIDLPDLTTMAVGVQVPEARIHQVSLGLRATISIDAQADLALRGTVTKIGLLPDYVNRWLNPDLKVYQTDITIDPDQDLKLLRPGMSAKVEILVKDMPDSTLYLPIQSVTTIDGATVAYLLRDKKFFPQPVEVGLSSDAFIEIKSGLNEGDLVQLNAPRPQGTIPQKEKEKKQKRAEIQPQEGFASPASYKGEEPGRPRKREEGKKDGDGGEGGPSGGNGSGGKKNAPATASPAAYTTGGSP